MSISHAKVLPLLSRKKQGNQELIVVIFYLF